MSDEPVDIENLKLIAKNIQINGLRKIVDKQKKRIKKLEKKLERKAQMTEKQRPDGEIEEILSRIKAGIVSALDSSNVISEMQNEIDCQKRKILKYEERLETQRQTISKLLDKVEELQN